jgi:hypothetical protein
LREAIFPLYAWQSKQAEDTSDIRIPPMIKFRNGSLLLPC